MKTSKRETAERLAKAHFEVEPNLKHVYLLEPVDEQDADKPIKLLEVVEGTIERGIEPIAFTADPKRGIEYPSVIIEVSPKEYDEMRQEQSPFGHFGWTIGTELLAS
jgi:hypothetical protein